MTVTADKYLGGRLTVLQPRNGYRAGIDPVFLAASVPTEPGQSVLELGCGAGVALLCLGARVPDLDLVGLELQSDYADLARRNGRANGIDLDVLTGSLLQMPARLKGRSFDHVIANPPYFDRSHGSAARNAGREVALGEGDAAPADWVSAGLRRLKPRGRLTMIQRPERLPELLGDFHRAGLGGITVLPLAPRIGRPSSLVLVSGIKGGRAEARLLAPVILHQGDVHEADGDDYTDIARAVLRDAAALPGFIR